MGCARFTTEMEAARQTARQGMALLPPAKLKASARRHRRRFVRGFSGAA